MPRYMSPNPETRAPSAEEFNSGNALARDTQPYLNDLFEAFADPNRRITFFVGAGVSVDAGYPNWTALLQRLAEKIVDPEFGRLAAADQDGNLRQAETIFRLIAPDTPDDDAGLLRDTLYHDLPQPTCGPLAETIAEIALRLGDRCSIITTNFDDVLEYALAKVAGTPHEECSFSLRNEEYSSEEPPPSSLDDCPGYVAWKDERLTAGPRAVMHLHGMTRRRDVPLRPLVLTESHFLRYGSLVRELMLEELQTSTVIFVGASLNDPNVTGPLWDLAQFTDGPRPHPTFALHVPGFIDGATDIHQSRAFGLAKFRYLETALNISPIFLKSYSQLLQLLIEMTICVELRADYSRESYGQRFERILRDCYSKVSITAGQTDSGSFEDKAQVSRNLQRILSLETEVGRLLREPSDAAKKLHRGLRHQYDDHSQDPEEERFGIFLWLRTPRTSSDEPAAPYSIDLVASSTYTHLDEWSGRRSALIEERSTVVAAECVFKGYPRLRNLPLISRYPLWRSALAFPLYMSSKARPGWNVVVGAVTLNSTFSVEFEDGERDSSVSILAALQAQPGALDDLIDALKVECINLLRA